MKSKPLFVTTALLSCGALSCTADAQSLPELKFSGFGTLSAVHADEREADFVGNDFQPKGAGYSRSTTLNPDSKLGGQVAAKLSDNWSAVVQVISQLQYDDSWKPKIEWANVKYQITPELSARVGRIALPVFLLSEARLVGYGNPSARPPTEVYGLVPLTSNDGIDASYRSTVAGFNNSFQTYYGSATHEAPGGTKADFKSSWGFNDSVESGAWTARAGFSTGKLSINSPGLSSLIGAFSQFAAGAAAVPVPAFQTAAAQAAGIAQTYQPEGVTLKIFTLGASYDPGNWYVTAELAAERFSKSLYARANAGYVTAGYRYGNLTPYATYSFVKAIESPAAGISTTGATALAPTAAALNGALNTVLAAFARSQTTVAAGLRWDFMSNFALKTQYERLSLGDNSNGRLSNVQSGFVPGGKVNVVTVAVDFVF